MNSELKPKIRFKGFTDDWEQRKLGEIFKYSRPDNHIVSNIEYLDYGKTPVLTANKAFVLGYTNESKTFDNNSIIFDDFTLESKYVDFPYMVKSSAIKILEVRDNIKDDLYYNYNLLNSIKIEILGHARHYISIVQPTIVRTTFIDEQKSIATLFANIDNLITLHQRKCDKLVELKKSLLEKMFPQNNSVIPEIRFKGFTDDWEQRKLADIGNIITGTTPSTSDESNYNGDYLFVSPADIHMNRYIEKTNTTLSKKGFESGRILNEGSVLFVSIGSTIGKVAQTKEKTTTNQQINAIEVNEKNNNNFIYSLLEKHSNNIRAGASTQAVPILNKTSFSLLEFDMPKIIEQERIGLLFENIDNLITLHQRKHDKLNKIKQSLLNDMFV